MIHDDRAGMSSDDYSPVDANAYRDSKAPGSASGMPVGALQMPPLTPANVL